MRKAIEPVVAVDCSETSTGLRPETKISPGFRIFIRLGHPKCLPVTGRDPWRSFRTSIYVQQENIVSSQVLLQNGVKFSDRMRRSI